MPPTFGSDLEFNLMCLIPKVSEAVFIPEIAYLFQSPRFGDAGEILVPTFAHIVYVPFDPYPLHSRSRQCCLLCGYIKISATLSQVAHFCGIIDSEGFPPSRNLKTGNLPVPSQQNSPLPQTHQPAMMTPLQKGRTIWILTAEHTEFDEIQQDVF
jgi:hypothetical protein